MRNGVYETRDQAVRYLSRELDGDFVVVSAPDHPFVLRSVDVIVGGRSTLTAVVTPTSIELRRPDYFMARVIINMMALPPNTKFVFAGIEVPSFPSKLKFRAELDLGDRSWTRDLLMISSEPGSSRNVDRAKYFQRRAEARFAETYRLARVLQRKARSFAYDGSSSGGGRPKRDRIGDRIEAAFFDGKAEIGSIAEFSFESALRWYEDFDGEPGPTESPASAIFADRFPLRAGDPNKVLRAAAFAGCVITPYSSRTLEEFGELIDRYTRIK